jgi:hypothetical protein
MIHHCCNMLVGNLDLATPSRRGTASLNQSRTYRAPLPVTSTNLATPYVPEARWSEFMNGPSSIASQFQSSDLHPLPSCTTIVKQIRRVKVRRLGQHQHNVGNQKPSRLGLGTDLNVRPWQCKHQGYPRFQDEEVLEHGTPQKQFKSRQFQRSHPPN